MHLPRRIFVTVLVLVVLLFCACVCEAQSSYDLNDAGIEMQSSYGGENGRRLQGSVGGNASNASNASNTTTDASDSSDGLSGMAIGFIVFWSFIIGLACLSARYK